MIKSIAVSKEFKIKRKTALLITTPIEICLKRKLHCSDCVTSIPCKMYWSFRSGFSISKTHYLKAYTFFYNMMGLEENLSSLLLHAVRSDRDKLLMFLSNHCRSTCSGMIYLANNRCSEKEEMAYVYSTGT